MVHKVNESTILGEVIRYSLGWIPISSMAHVVVKVGRDMIKIPVDQRQIKFIEKEYPVGEIVELEYTGRWRILSRTAPPDNDIIGILNSVY